ncbi:MAG: hypothetical protein K6E97_02280 [Treponema sp.]|nr:hypothetical protein [Treponema sp.]
MKKLTVVIASIVLGCLFSACKNGNSPVQKSPLSEKTYKLVSSVYYNDYYENGIKDYSEIQNYRIISENVVTEDMDSSEFNYFITITRTGSENNYEYTVNVDHYLGYDSSNGWEDRTVEIQTRFDNSARDREEYFNFISDLQFFITFIDETNVHIWGECLQTETFGIYEFNETGTEIQITAQGTNERIKLIYSKNDDTISWTRTSDTRVSGTGYDSKYIRYFEQF